MYTSIFLKGVYMEIEDKIVKMYTEDKISGCKISKELDISLYTVYSVLESKNIKRRSNSINSKKYKCNDNFFNIIDTEEKAYWLGFMYADGYIISDRDAIGLSLSAEDINHLEKFLASLNANNKISRYTNNINREYARVIIYSNKLKNDLISHGCLENKTFKLVFPNIDGNLIRHFIRGYFDGDGSLSKHKAKNGYTYRFRLCGTSSFLNSVLKYIGFEHKTLNKRHKDRNNDNYDIDIGGNIQVFNIMNYLYNDSTIFLDRKYNRFVDLKSLYSEKSK